ncbi:hypothetical protein ES705_30589 [subsurface metagenome]
MKEAEIKKIGKVSPEFQRVLDAINEWKKIYDDKVNILISCAKVDKKDNFLEEDNYLLAFLNTYMEFKKPFIRYGRLHPIIEQLTKPFLPNLSATNIAGNL